VTGARVSERTATTSPVPIDGFRGEDLRASGQQETAEILRQLAPSFAFATPTTPDGNTHNGIDRVDAPQQQTALDKAQLCVSSQKSSNLLPTLTPERATGWILHSRRHHREGRKTVNKIGERYCRGKIATKTTRAPSKGAKVL